MARDANALVRNLFKGGSVLFVGLFLELAISFFAKLLIARTLGAVDFGAVSLGVTTVTVVSTLTVLGLRSGIGRYLPRSDDPARRRGILLTAFGVAVPLSVATGVLVAVFSPTIATVLFTDPSIGPMLRIFALAIPVAAVMKLCVGTVQGLQLSAPKVYVESLSLPIVRFGGIVVVLLLGFGTLGIAWAYAVSYLVAALVGTYYLVRHTPILSDHDYDLVPRELLAFSAPLVVSAAMTLVFSDIDTFMLGYFSATADVGIYNVVYPLAYLLTVTLSAFSFLVMPAMSELHADGRDGEMRRIYQVVTKWVFFATVPLFLLVVLFPGHVIRLTFGAEYVPGAGTLAILALAFFSHSFAGPNVNTLTSIGETRLVMYVNVFVAALNVALNLVLVPRYSFVGAGIATAISYLALNVIYSVELYRLTGIHPVTRSLMVPGTATIATALALFWLVTTTIVVTPVVLLALAFGFGALYVGIVLGLGGVEEEEVMLVLSFEERFGVNLGPVKAVAGRLVDLDRR